MKKHLLLPLLICCGFAGMAQRWPGLTGVRDTSYSNYNAYQQTVKEHPYIRLAVVAPAKEIKEQANIIYCKANRPLAMDAFYPATKQAGGRPAILFIHGGGWRTGNKSQHHALARRLAQLGYVCFTPEYRLSTEALYPAAVQDLQAALTYVQQHAKNFGADPAKIAVAGFSAGGQLAALLGTTAQDTLFSKAPCAKSVKLAAIIDLDGVLAFIHPQSGEGDDSKRVSAATNWFGAAKTERPNLWQQASALTHAGKQTPPTLFINSSVDRMHAGRDDYRQVLTRYGIYSEVHSFAGAPHSFPLFHPWFDSTVQLMNNFLQRVLAKKQNTAGRITVAQDGTGDVTTVQAAFDAVPVGNKKPLTIFVKKGVYYEKLSLDSGKTNVQLVGEDAATTILTYNDHTGKLSPGGDTINTQTSQSFLQAADDFTATNITFQNNAGFTAGQAVAINIRGDRNRFFNCRFVGFQDVLFPSKPYTRQYFENCYIEGTTDFIFGPSTAWFESCHIHSKKNSHVTATSTPQEVAFGYVFNRCRLTADTGLLQVSLGRPWRPYASVTYLHCRMDGHILPEGWNNWRNPANEATARYAEYNSSGAGARLQSRVPWAKQLSPASASAIKLVEVMRGWNPVKEKPMAQR